MALKKSNLLIDNWTLQSASDLIGEGIKMHSAIQLIQDEKGEMVFKKTSNYLVQIDSLFNILVDIVTREKLVVDSSMVHAWENKTLPITNLYKKGIIESKEFIKDEEHATYVKHILDNLKISPGLVDEYLNHIALWKYEGAGINPQLSIVLGGTLGYLARGAKYGMTYSPHPTRRLFLKNTAFEKKFDSIKESLDWAKNQRQRFIKDYSKNGEFNLCHLLLDPIIVEIIESSSSIPNMFTTALQLRNHYKVYRKYFEQYQVSIEEGDLKALKKHKIMLNDVEDVVFDKYGKTEFIMGVGLIKIKQRTNLIQNLKSKFGVRATLKNMIFTKYSKGTLEKFLNMLDENNKQVNNKVIEYFSEKN